MSREGAEGEREADSLLNEEPDVGPIAGPQDHDLSGRQMLNQLSHPGVPILICFEKIDLFILETENTHAWREAEGERESQADFMLSVGPKAELNPRTVRYDLSRKSRTLNDLSHPGAPEL